MRGAEVPTKPDYYEVLGLAREASAAEIKAAYRKLARQHHPDVNPGDPAAEEQFKRINEAYEVLADPEKRSRYDRFGHSGVNGDAGFGPTMNPFDLFDLFFGGGPGGRRHGPAAGDDLRMDLQLTLEEAAAGVEREVTVNRLQACGRCSGSGAAPDSSRETCPACRGAGQVRATQNTFLGSFSTVTTCRNCGGQGQIVRNPCVQCAGQGVEQRRATLKVKIPAGVDDGQRMILRGEGDAGAGGPAGDLHVFFHLQPHPVFERHGRDLVCEVACSVAKASLGGGIEIPTLEGPRALEIPPGTQPGDMFRLRGCGMPEPNRPGRGDLLVVTRVRVPERLNDRQRSALEEFAAASGEELAAAAAPRAGEREGGGLLEWVRNIFGGKDG